MITLTFVASGVLLVLLVVYLTYRRGTDLREHAVRMRELGAFPTEAFRNLAKESELQFLRAHLSRMDFERCRCKRSVVLIGYLYLILRNTSVILRCTAQAAASGDPEVSKAARNVTDLAFRTRLNALKALILLSIGVLIPTVRCDLAGTLVGYNLTQTESFDLSARILQ
jgi:hypothetical protein